MNKIYDLNEAASFAECRRQLRIDSFRVRYVGSSIKVTFVVQALESRRLQVTIDGADYLSTVCEAMYAAGRLRGVQVMAGGAFGQVVVERTYAAATAPLS